MNKNENSADVRCLTRPTRKAWKSLVWGALHYYVLAPTQAFSLSYGPARGGTDKITYSTKIDTAE